MKTTKTFLLLLTGIFFYSCSNDKQQSVNETATDIPTSSTAPRSVQEAMKQAEDAIQKQGGQPAQPVNFRELQQFLPENAGLYTRSNLSGETAGAVGITISKAEATYKNAQGKTVRIDLVDTGGLGMTQMSMAAWASISVDKEDDKGYERTGQMDGYKSLEKYKKLRSECDLSILVGNRFIINASGRDCSMDDLKTVVRSIDLKKLEGLK
ncbi:MAG: hypothetical protein JNJ57_17865 [Saprospiraceae bacterium]|nr:hypothetical protein [Saprospiraceae bacterium]